MNYHDKQSFMRWQGTEPPNYVRVFQWRQKRVLGMRAYVQQLHYALKFYEGRPIDFINDWCDTVDPRRAGTGIPARVPFVLFERQRELTQFLHELVIAQANGLIEKSRDMGATWDAAAFSTWCWRFMPGSSVGWGSRKAELVDRIGDMDSIFEKIRAIIKGWPREFWPGFLTDRDELKFNPDRDMSYMKIFNPETGASITGESGDNIGRGGRKLIYFKDESAHYERPELIEAALGDNTYCQVDISSVNGPGNVFHRKREAGIEWSPGVVMERGKTYVFILDWADHPLKTQEWYDGRQVAAVEQGLEHIFEQEVNRNYYGAVSGTIIPGKFVKACVDAHLIIPGMEVGKWRAGLDVADPTESSSSPTEGGGDKHAYGITKNVVLKYAHHWAKGDAGEAAVVLIEELKKIDGKFEVQYDSVGVGAAIKTEVNRRGRLPPTDNDYLPKNIKFVAWNAGAGVLNPDDPVEPARPGEPKDPNAAINKEQFANLKAQAWWAMRRRCEKTMKAIEAIKAGKPNPYHPDELWSIDSSTVPKAIVAQIVKEMSQPVRKKDIVSTKFTVDKKPPGTRSPNLADQIIQQMFPVPVEGYDWGDIL